MLKKKNNKIFDERNKRFILVLQLCKVFVFVNRCGKSLSDQAGTITQTHEKFSSREALKLLKK